MPADGHADDGAADGGDEAGGQPAGSWAAMIAERVPGRWCGARWAVGKRGLMALAAVGLAAAVIAGVGAARDSPPDVAVPQVDTEVVPLGSPGPSRPSASAAPGAGAAEGEDQGEAAGPGEAAGHGEASGDGAGGGEAAGPGQASADGAEAEGMVVAVQGLVEHSGLVRLERGARVADALQAAGGPLDGADLLSLNLAQKLNDGDQVLVGVAPPDGEAPRLGSATIAAGGGPAGGSAGAARDGGAGGGPVDLNTATQSALETLPGVGPVTAQAILEWRSRNGRFTSVDQLVEVKGIGPATLADLRDAVTV